MRMFLFYALYFYHYFGKWFSESKAMVNIMIDFKMKLLLFRQIFANINRDCIEKIVRKIERINSKNFNMEKNYEIKRKFLK